MPKSALHTGTLIFHYHEKVYQDEQGKLWMSSSQGIWLDEIAQNFQKLYIFNFQTLKKTKKHDYLLKGENVEWISLGTNQGYVDFFGKRRRFHALCKKWSYKADHLLIRGFTPFQNKVWKKLKVKKSKSFILVRSLKQPRLLKFSDPLSWLAFLVNKKRESSFKTILETADNIFTNSKEVQQELFDKGKLDVKFSTTNVLKSRDFKTFEFNSWTDEFHLLFVGRISPLKGVNELIDAFSEVQANSKLKMFLHLVGEGDADYLKSIKERLEIEGLSQQVFFHGRVAFGTKIFLLYRNAHAFVLPSYTEGFPRVIWEAALFGTPIIATGVGGIPNLLQNRKHGVIVRPKSSVELEKGITKLMSKPVEAKVMAHQAFNLALKNTLESGIGVLADEIKNKA